MECDYNFFEILVFALGTFVFIALMIVVFAVIWERILK